MATLLDRVEYLSKEIGARPAGTEEEQQAALYIADQFQKESGFAAAIEEFTSSSNIEGARAIPAVVTVVVAILAMIFNVLTIPALILALIAAVVYGLEAFDRPIVSRALARGASQNVLAKYQPGGEAANASTRGRSRKIVLVAHYDSGKVTPPLVKSIDSLGLPVPLITVGGMALMVLLLLIRIFVGGDGGVSTIVLNVITILDIIVCLLPVVRTILYRMAPYNEGANNNASGVAAIIEVARRISRGSVSEADLAAKAEGVTIHGEQAAIESGLVPEGAQIRYEAERLQPPAELGAYDEEDRLVSAKAAIAALTGKPVERHTYGSVANKLVNSRVGDEGAEGVMEALEQPVAEAQGADAPAQPAMEAAEQAPAPMSASEPPAQPAEEASGFSNAPSWFIAAQQNAKKPTGDTAAIQRSRYNEAIESAERGAIEREQARLAEEEARREEAVHASILAAQGSIGANAGEGAEAADEPAQAAEDPDAKAAVQLDQLPQIEQPAPADAADPATTSYQAPITLTPEEIAAALADEQSPASNSRLAGLPAIDSAPEVPETTSPSRSGMIRKLRTDVPSMSGVIRMQEAGEDVSQRPVVPDVAAAPRPQFVVPDVAAAPAPAPAPAVAGADYNMEVPVSENFAAAYEEAVSPVYDEPQPALYDAPYDTAGEQAGAPVETGFAQPGEVSMPESRSGGFFSRFTRGKDADQMSSPQEWLDVDDDFDARTVGKKRGSWESFRDDQYDDFEDFDDDSYSGWNGGGYSRVRLGHVSTVSGEDAEGDIPDEPIETLENHMLTGEIERIYHFRNPMYNTEIWFAAIGSDTELHDGARAFVDAHRDELRGAMVIEVESLGAGALSVVTEEGKFLKRKASSRVTRYTRKATAATGIALDEVKLNGADSITTTVQKAGYQAMHLVGTENGGISLKGDADDVLENVDELVLDDNVNFLMELLKRN